MTTNEGLVGIPEVTSRESVRAVKRIGVMSWWRSTLKSSARWALFGLAVIIMSVSALIFLLYNQAQASYNLTTTYWYDPLKERWNKAEVKVPTELNPDGTPQPGSHTIVIKIDPDNPVKQITIEEALIINTSTEPLLEINGRSDPAFTGRLNIGKLIFAEVDAERLEIDAKVVRTTLENVVAEDNELDLDLDVVNVVRIGRGGTSSLFLGLSRQQLLKKLDTAAAVADFKLNFPEQGLTSAEGGLRVDRIRILGPDSSTGFIETLTIRQSSVFGKIRVENVAIQDLILKQVTLDDSP